MGHHHNHHHASAKSSRALLRALVLTSTFMFVEIIAGYMTQSMALLSDGFHMFTDAAAIGLSLFACFIAQRPPSQNRSFGYQRVEVLAAFANGIFLIILSCVILTQSWQRLHSPVEIKSLEALIIAVLGLGFNLITARELLKGDHKHINIRGAFLHVLGDTLGSVGAITAMALTYFLKWPEADAIVSIGISFLIIFSAWRLIGDTVHVMLEGVPHGLDIEKVRSRIQSLDDVQEVHDLHIWSLSPLEASLSAHVVSASAAKNCTHQDLLLKIQRILKDDFGISHTTIQIESVNIKDQEQIHL